MCKKKSLPTALLSTTCSCYLRCNLEAHSSSHKPACNYRLAKVRVHIKPTANSVTPGPELVTNPPDRSHWPARVSACFCCCCENCFQQLIHRSSWQFPQKTEITRRFSLIYVTEPFEREQLERNEGNQTQHSFSFQFFLGVLGKYGDDVSEQKQSTITISHFCSTFNAPWALCRVKLVPSREKPQLKVFTKFFTERSICEQAYERQTPHLKTQESIISPSLENSKITSWAMCFSWIESQPGTGTW